MVCGLLIAMAAAVLASCGDDDAGPASSIGSNACSEGGINREGDFSIGTLEDLKALAGDGSSCVSISGKLFIEETTLTSLEGLGNLYSVGGLRLRANPALTSLDGFRNVTRIDGDLEIVNNRALTNVDGLHKLARIGGKLEIRDNASLTSLEGLRNVTRIDGDLGIFGNEPLDYDERKRRHTRSQGDEQAARESEGSIFSDGEALSNLEGLRNLQSIGGIAEARPPYYRLQLWSNYSGGAAQPCKASRAICTSSTILL